MRPAGRPPGQFLTHPAWPDRPGRFGLHAGRAASLHFEGLEEDVVEDDSVPSNIYDEDVLVQQGTCMRKAGG